MHREMFRFTSLKFDCTAIPSLDGLGIVAMIFSIWLMVDEPGNKGLPINISANIQPKLHISTPFVYLKKTIKKSSKH